MTPTDYVCMFLLLQCLAILDVAFTLLAMRRRVCFELNILYRLGIPLPVLITARVLIHLVLILTLEHWPGGLLLYMAVFGASICGTLYTIMGALPEPRFIKHRRLKHG